MIVRYCVVNAEQHSERMLGIVVYECDSKAEAIDQCKLLAVNGNAHKLVIAASAQRLVVGDLLRAADVRHVYHATGDHFFFGPK